MTSVAHAILGGRSNRAGAIEAFFERVRAEVVRRPYAAAGIGLAAGWFFARRGRVRAAGRRRVDERTATAATGVSERQVQEFVGGPTTELPAVPGGYGGLRVG